ncbi:hypothetical protein VitviT2T_002282 [Vitis vinifera]|uniref:Uncharacterized protein n=1 Tax=Vitis vinifera TaxID=29760 RepID=A0ABY9BHY6_VITVI|nr:uncharacterized protein LOC100258674 isoform X1 [Vitis vinifera]WJZ82528.1 hypothetical protein VitviT2T_002282 [Vitis vinifera]|eukprot:XP_002265335.1 PREDICTED: uncharacterized protein LOC100258674 isoform X1 [Vitis vinifera]
MEGVNNEIGNQPRMRIENPFTLKVGQVFTGFGIGCGVGIGVGRPINMGAIPVVNQVMGATRGATDAFSGVGRHVNDALRKLGAKNIEAGIGCGVGFGHGFGVGLAVKPGVVQKIQYCIVQTTTKMMMKFGILPNIPIGKDIIPPSLSSTVQGIIPPSLSSTGQGILSPSLQSGMSMTNEPSSQNTTGSVLQLATKLVEQTSYGLAGDATSNTGSTSGASTSKSSQGTSLVSQTGKVVTNILHDLTSTEGGNEVNELAERLRSENNMLHVILNHEQIIQELKEENEKLRQVLVEDLNIPPCKLQTSNSSRYTSPSEDCSSYSNRQRSPCEDCFDCRRKERKR